MGRQQSVYMINGGRTGTSQFLLNGALSAIRTATGSSRQRGGCAGIQGENDQHLRRAVRPLHRRCGQHDSKIRHQRLARRRFEYFRNTVLDAKPDPEQSYRRRQGTAQSASVRGIVGGPDSKGQGFHFLQPGKLARDHSVRKVSNVPPLDLRDGQHFTNYNVLIFDPTPATLATRRPSRAADPSSPAEPARTSARRSRKRDSQGPHQSRGRKDPQLLPRPEHRRAASSRISSPPAKHRPLSLQSSRWAAGIMCSVLTTASMRWPPIMHGYEFRTPPASLRPIEEGEIFSQRTDQNYIADWTHVMARTKCSTCGSASDVHFDLRASAIYSASRPRRSAMTGFVHAPSVSFDALRDIHLNDNTEYAALRHNTVDLEHVQPVQPRAHALGYQGASTRCISFRNSWRDSHLRRHAHREADVTDRDRQSSTANNPATLHFTPSAASTRLAQMALPIASMLARTSR